MSNIEATTRVMRHRGQLYLSVATLEEMLYKMRRDSLSNWDGEISVLEQVIENARQAERVKLR